MDRNGDSGGLKTSVCVSDRKTKRLTVWLMLERNQCFQLQNFLSYRASADGL